MTIEITGDGIIRRNGIHAITIGTGPFVENPTTVSANCSLDANTNAMSAGPITIADGVTVTVSENSEWTIV